MKPIYKILLVLGMVVPLNHFFGMDWRFTIINIVWCIPIFVDFVNEEHKRNRQS